MAGLRKSSANGARHGREGGQGWRKPRGKCSRAKGGLCCEKIVAELFNYFRRLIWGLWAGGRALALARRLAHCWPARSAGAGVLEKIICGQFQTILNAVFF